MENKWWPCSSAGGRLFKVAMHAGFLPRYGLLLVVACGLFGCGSDDVDGAFDGSDRGITGNTQGLRLLVQDSGVATSPPAKVSVSFKVETDDGQPVTDLNLQQFTLFENDAQISLFESSPQIIPDESEFSFSSLLLLDFSGSVLNTSLEPLKAGAIQFVEELLPPFSQAGGSNEIAIAIFDGRSGIQVISEYSNNREALKAVIQALDASFGKDSSTNLNGAVIDGLAHLEDRLQENSATSDSEQGIDEQSIEEARVVAGAFVVFTDGSDQANLASEQAALTAINSASSALSIFFIGLGGELNTDTLAAFGREGFQQVAGLDDLVTSFRDTALLVSEQAKSFYKLDYCSPKRSGQNNRLTIAARIQDPNGEVRQGDVSVTFSAQNFTSGCAL